MKNTTCANCKKQKEDSDVLCSECKLHKHFFEILEGMQDPNPEIEALVNEQIQELSDGRNTDSDKHSCYIDEARCISAAVLAMAAVRYVPPKIAHDPVVEVLRFYRVFLDAMKEN